MPSNDLERYVAAKRSLGFKLRGQSVQLGGLLAFAEGRGDRHVESVRVLDRAANADGLVIRATRLRKRRLLPPHATG